jgi:hypothetical protein
MTRHPWRRWRLEGVTPVAGIPIGLVPAVSGHLQAYLDKFALGHNRRKTNGVARISAR